MACIEKIYSVSALIGSSKCNANCSFCAGKYLRPSAVENSSVFDKSLESAIKLSARYGGQSLSLTSSGEPLCSPLSVSNALRIYNNCAMQGAYFPNVNLFTNGIYLGYEREYNELWNTYDQYLRIWKNLGLTNIALSIHDVDNKKQAKAYGLNEYPNFNTIVRNVRDTGLGIRATLLLGKNGVDTLEKYINSIEVLINEYKINNITSWPIGNPDGTRNEYTPSYYQLFRIKNWLRTNAKLCHGHSWGGGVYDYNDNILRITDYVTKHNPKKDFVRQLVVFQDGTVAYSWIKQGALCMK